jgi:hypothetical protein
VSRTETPARPAAGDQRAHDVYSTSSDELRPSRANRIGARTMDIANRLRFVCASMPDDELIALACRMAVVEEKYASGDDRR